MTPISIILNLAYGVAIMSINNLTPKELQKMQQDNVEFILLDVRDPTEYVICNLGGMLIPMSELPTKLKELDKNKHYVVHCKLGMRSQKAAEMMQAAGFTHVQCLAGGIIAWANDIDPTMQTY